MDGLDHHDGIIDHDGDGQQQRREGKQVDGEAEYPKEEEGTYERHRYGNHRDEGRAEVLEEDIHYQEYQQQRDDEGKHYLLDRGVEELGHILLDGVLQSGRETLAGFSQGFLHVGGYLGGVRAGNLLHHTHHGGLAVVLQTYGVAQTAQFDACHIAQTQGLTRGVALEQYVLILGHGLQTTLVAQHILVSHIRVLAKLTWGSLDVLLTQGG